ncbi:MAG: histidine--tRNA ligase, partial [Geminicoccaceae bacterium]|nr:histidine--tRNA ligase [Geminicoccaceae bacterium]
ADVRTVRGTHDLVGEDMRRHRHVGETALRVARCFGFEEIATPIFEFTDVFARSLGDTSDVVSKEMYTFTDRGGDQLTLRPENTAGVVRAVISGGLMQNPPLKLFYSGPMFRFERPQKGRMRQFHQIGVETIGSPEPAADIEVIALGWLILQTLGIGDGITVELNSLGDPESRTAYRDRLVDYLSAYRDRLSADSRIRLERNPLRILDSKDDDDRAIIANAPPIGEAMNDFSRDFFARVQDGLASLGIGFTLNPKLVRGLDYYTHTTFEFTTDRLGAQSAVLAGGRYDGLMRQMGGPDTPGVGWASGIERLAMLLDGAPEPVRPVAIIPIGAAAESEATRLAFELRRAGHAVELAFRGKPGQRMKKADRANARLAITIGDDELARDIVKLRFLDTGEDREVSRSQLAAALTAAS